MPASPLVNMPTAAVVPPRYMMPDTLPKAVAAASETVALV